MSDGFDYEIIGRQAVANVIAGDTGFDTNFIVNALAEGTKRGVGEYQSRQDADKAKKDSAEQLRRAIGADAAWADAEVMVALAQPNQKDAATAIRDSARSAALAIKLSGDAQGKRVDAAQSKASDANKASYAAPNDPIARAKAHAWQVIAAAVSANAQAAIVPQGDAKPSFMQSMPSFLARRVGPLPVWGWGLTIVGGGTALALLVKALRK